MSDEDLILIPSPLVIPFSYHFLKKKLQKKLNLIIPAVPESALTYSKKKAWWNEDDYASWLLDYMNENGIKKCFIMGHSNSGAIAIRFAELHPERVKGIVVVDTIGVEERSVVKILWGRIIDAFLEWKLTLWGFYHLLWNLIFHMPNFIFQIWLSKNSNVMESASKLKVPVLILWGKNDHTIPLYMGHKLRKVIRKADLYISNKGSHDWIITRPDEATRVISEWIR